MAEVFKNVGVTVGPGPSATVYTVPSGKTSIVISTQVVGDGVLSLSWVDSSNSNNTTNLVTDVTIPQNNALNPLLGKLVLEQGDSVSVNASGASLDVTMSVLEIDNL